MSHMRTTCLVDTVSLAFSTSQTLVTCSTKNIASVPQRAMDKGACMIVPDTTWGCDLSPLARTNPRDRGRVSRDNPFLGTWSTFLFPQGQLFRTVLDQRPFQWNVERRYSVIVVAGFLMDKPWR